MVLPTNGRMAMSAIRTEFKRPAGPISLKDYYGAAAGLPTAGKISLSNFYGKAFLIKKVVAANVNNIILSALFTADEWASEAPKEVEVASGVTVGSTSVSVAAVRTGTGRGGTLKLVNNGEIQGAGGAGNSGAGGAAIDVQQSGLTIENNWGIRGGGGGGGHGGTGGTGGPGYYVQGYTASEGPTYSRSSYAFVQDTDDSGANTRIIIYWGGGQQYLGGSSQTSQTVGSVTYYRGAYQERYGNSSGYKYGYAVSRQYPSSYNVYTSGGAGGGGGAGGRGQGFNQARAGGSGGAAGAAGGTNAGSGGYGGTGGTGGTWGAAGAQGAPGATGNAGNNGGGSGGGAGAGGGPAGAAIAGVARTLINNNTINGAT